jgi:LysM repeat protein
MSRRDIIIISALLNAGLLIVLFVTAIKTPESSQDFASSPPLTSQSIQELALPNVVASSQAGDEVDLMLRQLAAQKNGATSQTSSHVAPASWQTEAKELTLVQPSSLAPIATTTVPQENITPQNHEPAPQLAISTLSPVSAPAFVEVKIKKGDYLDKIARNNKTTVSEIMKVNHLSNTNLRIGQVLKIPNNAGKANPPRNNQQKQTTVGSPYYIVKNGDNPWTIASKNKLKLSELLRLNNLNEESARQLKPGDQLRIR